MTGLALRKASVDDADELAAFAALAFWDTYREIDHPDDIAGHVAEYFEPSAVASLIRQEGVTALLAELEGRLAGYAILRNIQAPACVSGPRPIEISRFYLGKPFLGRGLGVELMLAVHAEARRQGAQTVWLSVYDRNLRAVAFYERFGFTKVGGKEVIFGGKAYIDPIYVSPVQLRNVIG